MPPRAGSTVDRGLDRVAWGFGAVALIQPPPERHVKLFQLHVTELQGLFPSSVFRSLDTKGRSGQDTLIPGSGAGCQLIIGPRD